jgi:hypothetical protein
MEAKGPGSDEGLGEQRHWGYVNGNPSVAEKAWLLAELPKHVTDPVKRVELKRWILDRRRSRRDVEQLCKRWGIELPERF